MNYFRDFSSSNNFESSNRSIDSDAPNQMRQELIDLIFHLAESNPGLLSEEIIHRIISQSLGIRASAQPSGGFRYAAGRDIAKVEWQRVYDLITRLWPEFVRAELQDLYRLGVNNILSGYSVVWELEENGRLRRVVPVIAANLIAASISELSASRFAAALALMDDARDAFDDRPRRNRDACSNVFDCMESVAKEVFQKPNDTFGSVLNHIRKTKSFNVEVISVLNSINDVRNKKFGHGMTVPFDLTSEEVDFVYLTCIGAIWLIARS